MNTSSVGCRAIRFGSFGLVLALGLLTGCHQLNSEQRYLLRDGESQYAAQRYSVAVTILDRFLEKAPRQAPEWPRGLYVRGMSHVQAGDRAAAYKDLRHCVQVAKDRELVWKAYVTLGTMYYEDENWDQALVNLRAAASRMPTALPKDAVLYRLGQTLDRLGRQRDAQQVYAQLRSEFPRSAYGRDAGQKVDRIGLAASPPSRTTATPVYQAPASPPAGGSFYAVQAGAFASSANAERRAAELRKAGFDAYVQIDPANRTPRHVVLVGRYSNRVDADRQLQRVRTQVRDALIWP